MQFFAQIFSSRVARLKKWSFCFSWICLLFQPSCSYSGNVSLRYLFVDYYWSVLAALRRCDRLVVSVGWFGAICDFASFIFNQVTTGSFIKHKVIRTVLLGFTRGVLSGYQFGQLCIKWEFRRGIVGFDMEGGYFITPHNVLRRFCASDN